MTAYSLRRNSLDPGHRFSTVFAVLVLHVALLFLLALGVANRELPTAEVRAPVIMQDLQFVEPVAVESKTESPPAADPKLDQPSLPVLPQAIERPVADLPVAPSIDQLATGAAPMVSGTGNLPGARSGDGLGVQSARPPASAVAVRARKRSGYISSEDYPRKALSAKAEGTTSVSVTISANGLVTACTVSASSGRADLDATVCRLMSSRYRFEPGRNSNGEPVSDVRTESFTWILPAND